jgi:TPR repeat protein
VLALILIAVPSLGAVREDQRACQYGFWKQLTKGASPPRTTNPDEQYCIGLAYWFQPSPLRRDPARAAEWFEAAAKQGQVGALVALGYQYEKGRGVAANPAKAFDLYQRAAGLGSSDAMFNVFRLYTTGKGVKADSDQARKWLEKAAAAGSIDARKELATIARGDYRRPGQEIEDAAYTAYMKKDYGNSVRLYRQASDLGSMAATVGLGQLYAQGLGVPKDLKQAARLYRVAADKGNPAGQAQLGFAYETGEGVPENWNEMRRWCKKSADQHHPLGLNCVGRLYQFGMAVPMNRAQAIAWFDKASDQDNPYARWFAIYLRKPANCTGFRSDRERIRFFGVCTDPEGITFWSSKQRDHWLGQRMAELQAQLEAAKGRWASLSNEVCTSTGGTALAGTCTNSGGHTYDPFSGRCRGSDTTPC